MWVIKILQVFYGSHKGSESLDIYLIVVYFINEMEKDV